MQAHEEQLQQNLGAMIEKARPHGWIRLAVAQPIDKPGQHLDVERIPLGRPVEYNTREAFLLLGFHER